ncbi:NADH-dependent fumarate reductase [Reticulomyxa filosa]|uniref:NADH-dependent fumarate reductase n=1 Tax=Reticulomyxa filosa TaxID=46433 RepID=X6NGG3_RETFI|nr:NADH-dependent fumarate reductase [Reticulomyxa filosa]|eukprot:ETO25385.1 NADH-dependent fumarate reductase [Reticulomyxa filosa]
MQRQASNLLKNFVLLRLNKTIGNEVLLRIFKGKIILMSFVSFLLLCIMATAQASEEQKQDVFCSEELPLIIVGSGLAGHAAAADAYRALSQLRNKAPARGSIVVLEKEDSFGGNSMKATSGINGALSEFQTEQKIEDSLEDFKECVFETKINPKDVMYSYTDKHGEKANELVTVLTESSGDAVNWLRHEFGLEMTSISQCGGHSHPRTHRPPSGPAGTMIVKAVHSRLQDLVDFRYKCEVKELLIDDETKTVIGVKYLDKSNADKPETKILRGGAVILASGGYANDHTSDSLLNRYSLMHENELPTTNGPFATGDGVKMASKIGANLIDMSAIQIHPTGFIDPKKPNERTKFLAPEALRGCGGILINNNGLRFVDELDLRSKVVDKEREQQKKSAISSNERSNEPFRILLNEEAANKFGPNLGFYIKMG